MIKCKCKGEGQLPEIVVKGSNKEIRGEWLALTLELYKVDPEFVIRVVNTLMEWIK